MLRMKRRYHFAAAHRLHSDAFSEAENREVFGQCNNLEGHGHNYEFEVHIEGVLCAETQTIVDLVALDACVEKVILNKVDHKFLDRDVPMFEGIISTAENISRVFVNELHAPLAELKVVLAGVLVQETPNNKAFTLNSRFEPLETALTL